MNQKQQFNQEQSPGMSFDVDKHIDEDPSIVAEQKLGSVNDIAPESEEQSQYAPPSSEDLVNVPPQTISEKSKKPKGKTFLATGIALLVVAVIGFGVFGMTSSGVNANLSVDEAQAVLTEGTSSTLPVGAVLLGSDKDSTANATDYVIYNKDGLGEAKVYIWDYAAVDGDYVQVLVDGEPVGDAFKIDHDPKEFNVPTSGVLQIKGIHDAGGGLTYAAYCNLNDNIYFNIAPEGTLNTYTFVTG